MKAIRIITVGCLLLISSNANTIFEDWNINIPNYIVEAPISNLVPPSSPEGYEPDAILETSVKVTVNIVETEDEKSTIKTKAKIAACATCIVLAVVFVYRKIVSE